MRSGPGDGVALLDRPTEEGAVVHQTSNCMNAALFHPGHVLHACMHVQDFQPAHVLHACECMCKVTWCCTTLIVQRSNFHCLSVNTLANHFREGTQNAVLHEVRLGGEHAFGLPLIAPAAHKSEEVRGALHGILREMSFVHHHGQCEFMEGRGDRG